MQPVSLGQHRVHERLADVDAPAAGLQHPLHELLHLRGGEHEGGQLVAAVAGHEDPARVVDPDLLDRGVVEERLERPEPRHPGDQLTDHRVDVGHRRDRAGEAAVVVLADHRLRDPPDQAGLALGIHGLAAHHLPHVLVELLDELLVRVRRTVRRRVRRRVRDRMPGGVGPRMCRMCRVCRRVGQ